MSKFHRKIKQSLVYFVGGQYKLDNYKKKVEKRNSNRVKLSYLDLLFKIRWFIEIRFLFRLLYDRVYVITVK